MEEALVALLLADAGVAALAGDRIHWTVARPAITPPYAILSAISRVPDVGYAGPTGLWTSRVQVDCYALTYVAALNLARAIIARLSGFSGSHLGITFCGVFLDASRDTFEPDASPDALFRTSMDFTLTHKGA